MSSKEEPTPAEAPISLEIFVQMLVNDIETLLTAYEGSVSIPFDSPERNCVLGEFRAASDRVRSLCRVYRAQQKALASIYCSLEEAAKILNTDSEGATRILQLYHVQATDQGYHRGIVHDVRGVLDMIEGHSFGYGQQIR